MPSIKPIDKKLIEKIAKGAKGIFTIEEHSTIGGLGAAVGEVLWENNFPKESFHAFGLPEATFLKDVGDRDHMLKIAGLESTRLSEQIAARMRERS